MKKLYNFGAWQTAEKHEKPVKEFLIFKREAPGHLPGLPND